MTKANLKIADLNALIVDDSTVQRQHVKNMCQTFGLSKLSEAVDGQDALKKLAEETFDLVFIDLEMPVMDGVSLVREIAAKKLVESVIILSSKDPILILSVGTMAENDGLTVLGTFKKPLQSSYLNSSLKKLLEEKGPTKDNDATHEFSPEELAEAIKTEQIIVFFQPKLNVASLLLNGVEVLVRWQHPEYGIVPPDKFIPLAERFGFIDELTYKIFRLALAQKQIWNKKGASFTIALNLSPLSLNEVGIVEHIIDLVNEFQIAPEDVILEITENAIAEQVSQSIEMLARLRLQGFQISIDDFGTGYANIQQLSRVPANELKIDRSMITDIANKPQQQAILQNTLNMAADLGLRTVVEGVEFEEDFQYLRHHKVDLMQGYLLAKPLSAKDFERWWQSDLGQLRKKLLKKT